MSDFCRRAGYAATPAEVREALSLLGEDEDFRVRDLAGGEPKASGLSPMALVDMLSGTAEDLAATRQFSGYYQLARQLVTERERTAPPAPAPASPSLVEAAPAAVAAWSPPPAAAKTRQKKAAKQTLEERIAPKKRPGPSPSFQESLPPLEPAHAREAARPKGRYSVVAPARESVEGLFRGEGKDLLAHAVEQHPDRFALTRALGESWGGRKEGQPLRTEDLERALDHHGLTERLVRKEREAVLGAYTEARGAGRRAANALNLSYPELTRLVVALGVGEEVEAIRERYRRDALSPKQLGNRLDLLGREKYLQDLGIRRKFDETLREDLRQLLVAHARGVGSGRDLILTTARMEGAPAELLWRAVEKLGLTSEVKALFPDDPDANYAP